MEGKINKYGNLEIMRAAKLVKQWCPETAMEESCGDWCPHFGEPIPLKKLDYEFNGQYMKQSGNTGLELCRRVLLFTGFVDERSGEDE